MDGFHSLGWCPSQHLPRVTNQPALEKSSGGHPGQCPSRLIHSVLSPWFCHYQKQRLIQVVPEIMGFIGRTCMYGSLGRTKKPSLRKGKYQGSSVICFFHIFNSVLTAKSCSIYHLLYLLPCQLAISGYLSTHGPSWPLQSPNMHDLLGSTTITKLPSGHLYLNPQRRIRLTQPLSQAMSQATTGLSLKSGS